MLLRDSILSSLSCLSPLQTPLIGFEKEISFIRKSLCPSTTPLNYGTTSLIHTPSPTSPIPQALIQQSILNIENLQVVHLNGSIYSEHSSLIREIRRQFPLASPEIRTFEELVYHLKDVLQNRKVLFVLEDFHRYAAHPQHQHFLYSLFDLCSTPLAGLESNMLLIIGISSRLDSIDLLEKRVKSRFSQNILYCPPPRTEDEYLDYIKAVILPNSVSPSSKYYKSVQSLLLDIKDRLLIAFSFNKDPTPLLPIFFPLISDWTGRPEDPIRAELIEEGFLDNYSLILEGSVMMPGSPSTSLLPPLSTTEWCVLAALRRVRLKSTTNEFDTPSSIKKKGNTSTTSCNSTMITETKVNFELIYKEYSHGFRQNSSLDAQQISTRFSRSIMKEALDSLIKRGIIKAAGGASSSTSTPTTIDVREGIEATIPLGIYFSEAIQSSTGRFGGCPEGIAKLACESFY